ncbi:hypothetical protein ACFX13_023212 [Malus domestica]
MSAASQVDPHDKMRARNVNRVGRGEQAPRPAHEYGSIKSAPSPPPPSSASTIKDHSKIEVEDNPTARHCYASYIQFHK